MTFEAEAMIILIIILILIIFIICKKYNLILGGSNALIKIRVNDENTYVEQIIYPSADYDMIHKELTRLQDKCSPNYPYIKPYGESAMIFILKMFNNVIIGMAIVTDLDLLKNDAYFEQKGGIKNKKGLFITSVCSDFDRYSNVATLLLKEIDKYALEHDYTYLLLHALKYKTDLHNEGSRKGLYIKNGFYKVGSYRQKYIMRKTYLTFAGQS